MKLTTNTRFEPECVVTAAEAVAYVALRAEKNYDGREERATARVEALEGMLGRLIGALMQNGALRASQLDEIFDYDVSAEN